jgi:hypothetical protein
VEFPPSDIADFDAWIRNHCQGPYKPEWEDHLRPRTENPPRPPFVLYTVTVPPVPQRSPQPLPPHVSRTLIEHAVATGATCPITLEPIQTATATTTPCGHVFNTAALRRWLCTHDTCPECRAPL